MAWNKPNDNDSELDPWGKKNNDDKNDIKNIRKKEIIKKNHKVDIKHFLYKIRNTIAYKNNSSKISKKKNNPIFVAFFISFFIWFFHGFYTIKENEQGVVTNCGKFSKIAEPGLNWRPIFINKINVINIVDVHELTTCNVILTSDENIIHIETHVEYKIIDPVNYLFFALDVENNLRQAAESSIRSVISNLNMNQILNEEQKLFKSKIHKKIKETIKPYNMGVDILDIDFYTIELPKEVRSSFEDARIAREYYDQHISSAKIYVHDTEYHAHRQAENILNSAKAYASDIFFKSEVEKVHFSSALPERSTSKKIILKNLYLKSIERLLRSTEKIFINQKNALVFLLSLDQFLNNHKLIERSIKNHKNIHTIDVNFFKNNKKKYYFFSMAPDNILEQRRINIIRSDVQNLEK